MEWPSLPEGLTGGSLGMPGQRGTGPHRAPWASATATPVTPAPPVRDVAAPAGGRSARGRFVGGRSAAALVSVGRRAQITKKLQLAAAAGGNVGQKIHLPLGLFLTSLRCVVALSTPTPLRSEEPGAQAADKSAAVLLRYR